MPAVRDVMTRDIATLEPDASIVDAARLMRDRNIGNVLVASGDELRGIVTDRDITVSAVADGGDLQARRVEEICSADLVTVSPDEDASTVAQRMREASVRRIPVVEDGRPVGIVSIGDLAVELDSESALADISADSPNS